MVLTFALMLAILAFIGLYAALYIFIRRLRCSAAEIETAGDTLAHPAHSKLRSRLGPLSTRLWKMPRMSFTVSSASESRYSRSSLDSDYDFCSDDSRSSIYNTPSLSAVPYAGPGASSLSTDALLGLPQHERDHVSRF